jgi:hypothetical protein
MEVVVWVVGGSFHPVFLKLALNFYINIKLDSDRKRGMCLYIYISNAIFMLQLVFTVVTLRI